MININLLIFPLSIPPSATPSRVHLIHIVHRAATPQQREGGYEHDDANREVVLLPGGIALLDEDPGPAGALEVDSEPAPVADEGRVGDGLALVGLPCDDGLAAAGRGLWGVGETGGGGGEEGEFDHDGGSVSCEQESAAGVRW